MTTEELLKLIEPDFRDDVTGHDIFHIIRVLEMARFLQSKEGGDLELIEYAAILHDLDDHKFNGGKLNQGGNAAKSLLIKNGIDYSTAEAVKEIVDQVSFKGANTECDTNKMSLNAMIVQDADRLDAIGAIGIARTFAYGGSKKQKFYHPDLKPKLHNSFEEYVNSETTSINHFHEKLLLLKNRLNTNTAKEIAEDRHRFMEEFLSRFDAEWNVKLD